MSQSAIPVVMATHHTTRQTAGRSTCPCGATAEQAGSKSAQACAWVQGNLHEADVLSSDHDRGERQPTKHSLVALGLGFRCAPGAVSIRCVMPDCHGRTVSAAMRPANALGRIPMVCPVVDWRFGPIAFWEEEMFAFDALRFAAVGWVIRNGNLPPFGIPICEIGGWTS